MCLGYGESYVPLTAAAHTASLPILFCSLSCASHVPWVWQNLCTSDFATAHTASFTVFQTNSSLPRTSELPCSLALVWSFFF
jgi:hypothetical protein